MRFHSKPLAEHEEVPLADHGQWEELVAHWNARDLSAKNGDTATAAYVVSVVTPAQSAFSAARMQELVGLATARGDVTVGSETHLLRRPNPRMLLGKGAARQIADRAKDAGATMVIMDAELTPSQARNLEDETGTAICDREALILGVFLRHAQTQQAKIQVEIANLEYLRPRIRGLGLDMDQQAGGVMRGRGPGETASELMARHLDTRLGELRKALERIKRSGRTQRASRDESMRIALVGYTNAGKTSLMNALSGTHLTARDQPFETLDTTSRALSRHGGDVMISDTVGFIRQLPRRLLASFESTLSEIREASLLAIVSDVSDPECRQHLEDTVGIIAKMGAGAIPRHHIFNKADRVSPPPRAGVLETMAGGQGFSLLSSHDPEAVLQLRDKLLAEVRVGQMQLEVTVPHAQGALAAEAYRRCRVLSSSADEDGLHLLIAGAPHTVAAISRRAAEAQS